MFIESASPKNIFAPEERDIRIARQNIALLQSEEHYFWLSEL